MPGSGRSRSSARSPDGDGHRGRRGRRVGDRLRDLHRRGQQRRPLRSSSFSSGASPSPSPCSGSRSRSRQHSASLRARKPVPDSPGPPAAALALHWRRSPDSTRRRPPWPPIRPTPTTADRSREAPLRGAHRRPRPGRRRSMLKAVGFTDDDLAKPIVGVGDDVDRDDALQLNQRRPGGAGEGGHPGGRRHADGVQHHLGQRRRDHGHRGHEGVADQPRGDRRLDRAGRPRPPVRRPRLRSSAATRPIRARRWPSAGWTSPA